MDALNEIMKRVEGLSPEQRALLLDRLQKASTTGAGESFDRTLFDVFNDHGMIGSITDVPEDWSTNPKYMKGFGQDAQ
jgi:hypothetical protein